MSEPKASGAPVWAWPDNSRKAHVFVDGRLPEVDVLPSAHEDAGEPRRQARPRRLPCLLALPEKLLGRPAATQDAK